jgi:cytosine deaminase
VRVPREIREISEVLADLAPDESYPDDRFILAALREAVAAAGEGNFGIGAVVASGKRIVARGRNMVFSPYFLSDLHAEMVAMNRFESRHRARTEAGDLALYTTLEPCPMCLTRLITARIPTVKFATEDRLGGMASRLADLPPAWPDLAKNQTFAPAQCSPTLVQCASELATLTLQEGNRRLRLRG